MCVDRQVHHKNLSAHLLQQQVLSVRPPPEERTPSPAFFPSFPLNIFFNHISEYASVIFSFVESFAHKALVAYNCGLRFNGSIMQYVCKALSNLLSCCLMIWKLLFEK
jgi:hypothetical protein